MTLFTVYPNEFPSKPLWHSAWFIGIVWDRDNGLLYHNPWNKTGQSPNWSHLWTPFCLVKHNITGSHKPAKNNLFQEPEARFILWAKQFLGPLQLQRKILVQLLLKSRISEIFWVSSITWHGPWIIALMSSDIPGKCCRCLPLDACLHHEHREIEQHEGSFTEGCHFDHIPLIFKLFRMYLCFYSCSTPTKKTLESSRFDTSLQHLLLLLQYSAAPKGSWILKV